MPPSPLVSVITATRNRTELLARALRSIARQSLCNIEIIVVDDGSDAHTQLFHDTLARELGERFVWIKPVAPGCPGTGPAAARNRGIEKARGDFVAFLDDDDEWIRDDHLSVAVNALETSGGDYFFSNMKAYRNDIDVLTTWFRHGEHLASGKRISDSPTVYKVPMKAFVRTMQHDLVHPDTTVVRRHILRDIGGFVNRLSYGEDYNLMMRIADKAKTILYRPCVVAKYRLPDGDSVSLTNSHLDGCLQTVFGTQHVRLKCSNPALRKCARAREAWSLREMAGAMDRAARGDWEATRLRYQAMAVYPTAGAMLELVRSIGNSLLRR